MLPDRLDYSAENCSIAAALAVVGEKWTLLVLREAFYGLRRFEDFLQATGCARNILGNRLAKLVEEGLLERVAYREESQRQRHEYRLSRKGLELFPVLVALMEWGDRWMTDKAGPAVQIRHRGCDAPVRLELCCDADHTKLSVRDTYAMPGKGARRSRR